MRLFVDASGWVPMESPRDHWAPRLDVIMREFTNVRLDMVTTNWTLYEALAQARRSGTLRSLTLYQRAITQAEVVAVDVETEIEALRRFLSWADKSASIVDHANMLVALAQRCEAILSFDADFRPLAAMTGLRVLA